VRATSGNAARTADSGGPGRTILRVARSLWWPMVVMGALFLVSTRFTQVQAAAANAQPELLLLSLLLLLGQLLPSSLIWSVGLRHLGQSAAAPLPTMTTWLAMARSLPARYVPGSVWFAASRAAILAREHGVSKTRLGAIAVIELAITLASAIALGTAALLASGRDLVSPVLLASAGAAALVAISPPVLNRVLAAVARRRGVPADRLSWAALGQLLSIALLHWAWSTTSFLLFLKAFPALSGAPLATLAGAYLISWAIAFLTILAPQGAGIFELTLAAFLGAAAATGVDTGIDTPTVAVVLGGHRALVVVRDVILAVAATTIHRRGTQANART
jgi:hypothetical protein